MRSKNSGRTSVGGSRPTLRRQAINERPAPFECDPRVVALLRAVWARRAEIRAQSTKDMILSFLGRARRQALTDAQLDAAASVGRALGIGFDDPRLDDPSVALVKTAPWGPLPLRPPRVKS